VTIRPAQQQDIDTIVRIIGGYASEGLMLPRSHNGITAALPDYIVADVNGDVVGCGGLQQYSSESAEIYGLATVAGGSPPGTGTAIVQALINKARAEQIGKVFAMTLAPVFFEKMGFHSVPHSDVPLKVWKDCVSCPKFGNCDEIAMVLELSC
jgi:amino-acid N-acetyltransferase